MYKSVNLVLWIRVKKSFANFLR